MSTIPGNNYGYLSGTSMATPFVSGIAALIKSNSTELDNKKISEIIKQTVTNSSTLNGKVSSNGYVNANNALIYNSLQTSNVNAARYGASSVVANGKLYLIGGYNNGDYLNSVEMYNSNTNEWEPQAPMNTARVHAGVTAVGDKIFAVGGYEGIATNVVEVYNTSTNTWSYAANIPASLYGMGITSVGNSIYVLGGMNNGDYYNTVYEYNTVSNTWTQKSNMPQIKSFLSAVSYNGEIYTFGGVNGNGCDNSTYQYSPYTDTWEYKAGMPYYKRNAPAVVFNGKAYVLGGTNQGLTNNRDSVLEQNDYMLNSYSPTVCEYDFNNNTWDTLLNTQTYSIGATGVVYDNRVCIIAGWNGIEVNNIEKYFGTVVPSGITVTTSLDKRVTVAWDSVEGAAAYDLEIDGQITNIPTGTSYSFSVSDDNPHNYRVRVVKGSQHSSWSEMITRAPNNNMLDAVLISGNSTTNKALSSMDDVHWYKISEGVSGTISLVLSGIPQDCVYRMALCDYSGMPVMQDTSVGSNRIIDNFTLSSYDYYVQVYSEMGCNASLPYTLTSVFQAVDNNEIPERLKISGVQPADLDGTSIDRTSIKTLEEIPEGYIPEEKGNSEEVSTVSHSSARGGCSSNAEYTDEGSTEVDSDVYKDGLINVQSVAQTLTPISDSLTSISDTNTHSITINRSLIGSGNMGRIIVELDVANPGNYFKMEWTSSNTQNNNFWYYYNDDLKKAWLVGLVSTGSSTTYSFKVKATTFVSNGSYTVRTKLLKDVSTAEDYSSLNNLAEQATTITLTKNTKSNLVKTGKIDFINDEDYYKVYLNAGDKLTASLQSPSGKQFYVDIRNSNDNFLDGWSLDGKSNASYKTTSSGYYYIRVHSTDAYGNDNFDVANDYTLNIYCSSLTYYDGYEVNDEFEQANQILTTVANWIGGRDKYTNSNILGFDNMIDIDRIPVTLSTGDKLSIELKMHPGYADSASKYRIEIHSSPINGTYTSHSYDNPDSPMSKYATFIAPSAGTYYVAIKSYGYGWGFDDKDKYDLTTTKVLSSQMDSYEVGSYEGYSGLKYSNDFATGTINSWLTLITAHDITNQSSVENLSLDNQLDVDWYYIQPDSKITKTITLQSNNSNFEMILLDKYGKVMDSGLTITHNFEKDEIYYLGITSTNWSADPANTAYSLGIIVDVEGTDNLNYQLDNDYCGLEEIWFSSSETFVHLSKPIPANKIVAVSFIASYLQSDGTFPVPVPDANNYIENVALFDQNGTGVSLYGGWYSGAKISYFKIENAGYYRIRMKFKSGVQPRQAYIGVYTTDYITNSDRLTKYDALDQYQNFQGDSPYNNNYLIFNAPEHLSTQNQLGDNYRYISKMPVNGNANIYWEHLNKYNKTMTYGILLHNTSGSSVNVTINKKSAYSSSDGIGAYQAPLRIWNDYYDSLIMSDLTGISSSNNVLTIEPNSSEWIYLKTIPDIYGTMFNGIINLSVGSGATLDCYAFMVDDVNARTRIESDFNLYGAYGASNNYLSYVRAEGGYGQISGTTNGPVLVSNLNLSNSNIYKLLLTGYDAPFINSGELMPLYYDNGIVMENAQNFSVIYRFNISGFTGTKVVFQHNPYTNPNYLADPDGGIYVAYEVRQSGVKYANGSKVVLTYDGGTQNKFAVNLPQGSFTIDIIASGMSALPLTVSFE